MMKSIRIIICVIFYITLFQIVSATEIYRDDMTSLSNMSSYNNITLDAQFGTRYGQVIFGNNSWEQGISFSKIKLVNGIYEALYDCNTNTDFSGTGNNSHICYANSTDGYTFTKPTLNLFGATNIFWQNASMDVNNHFDWQYRSDYIGDTYPYKLMIGRHDAAAGGTWYFDLWKSVNLQTLPIFVTRITSSTILTPQTLEFNGTNWFLYYQDMPAGNTRHTGYYSSNNLSFQNSTWSNGGNVDTLITIEDQKHFINALFPSITLPNNEQYAFWDDMSGLNTNPIGIEQLCIAKNNIDWRLRCIAVPNMTTNKFGIIPTTVGGFDSGWVLSTSGFIQDPTTNNWRAYYSGSNTTSANSFTYGGVGLYEWTNHQVNRLKISDKINKSTEMDVLPNASGWTGTGTNSGNSVSNGILEINNTAATSDYYTINTLANDTASERLDIKFRMKVISKTGAGQGIVVYARTNSFGTGMSFDTTGFWLLSDAGQVSNTVAFNTTGDFHNYELECGSGNCKAYADGNLVITGRAYFAGAPGVTYFLIGKTGSTGLSSVSQWDWVRYSYGNQYSYGNETNANFTSINISIPSTTNVTYQLLENHTANVVYDLIYSNGTVIQTGISNGSTLSVSSNDSIALQATLTNSTSNDVYYWAIDQISSSCNWCAFVNVTVYNNGTSKTYNPTGSIEGNLTLSFFPEDGVNDILIYNLTTDNLTTKIFNHSSNNESAKITFILSNLTTSSNFSVKRYNSSGIIIADQWIQSNSTGFLKYNATLFNGSQYTTITPITPSNPVTVLIGVATVIIGGVAYYLRRVKKI